MTGILHSIAKAGSQTLIYFAFLLCDSWENEVLAHVREANATLLCPWVFVSASKEGWAAELVERWH